MGSFKVLVIIPAYNEEGNIERVVNSLKAYESQLDYIIINDGSSDSTKEICERNHYHFISHQVNIGLAGTFQTGMKYALKHGYDAAVQFDGDGQHRPEYISMMAQEIQKGADIVIGSRFLEHKKPHSLRMFGSRMICGALKLVTGRKFTDPTSGMRMYSKRMIEILSSSINLNPEPDTIAYLVRCGAKVEEVQVEMDERVAGESYLTLSRSISYMINVTVSILLIVWFRPRIHLEEN